MSYILKVYLNLTIYYWIMLLNMGKRKLVGTSHSTILLAVPVEWARSIGVKAGDEVEVKIDDAGRLIISAEGQK
jgi:hypothetical protein